jgi:hypothetical protein
MIVIERDGKTVVITGWRAWVVAAVAVVVTTAVFAALAFLVLGIAVSVVAFLLIVRPFPPRPPPEVASLCSVASTVLWPHPTSHPRTCSACGYCLPEPARHKAGHG